METINTIRESLPKEVEYLKIYFSTTILIISSIDLGTALVKELIQSQYIENRPYDITWAIQKTAISLASSFSRFFRDANVYTPWSRSTKSYIKSILYAVSGLVHLVKIVLAIEKANERELDLFEQVGIFAGISEDIIKLGLSRLYSKMTYNEST